MKLPLKIKSKITSMLKHSHKSIELQKEVEQYLMQEMGLQEVEELEKSGILDAIIDTVQYSFDDDGLIEFIEENSD